MMRHALLSFLQLDSASALAFSILSRATIDQFDPEWAKTPH